MKRPLLKCLNLCLCLLVCVLLLQTNKLLKWLGGTQNCLFFKNLIGLEPVGSHTEKLCKAPYYRQHISMNNKIKIIKSIRVLLAQALGP